MRSPSAILVGILRSFLTVLLAAQPCLATVVRAPLRLRAEIPNAGSAAVTVGAGSTFFNPAPSEIVPSAAGAALPSAPGIILTPVAAPAASPELLQAASRELSEALRKGEASAVETSGRHFDGLRPAVPLVAAPEDSGSERSGKPGRTADSAPAAASTLASALPDTVKFHGLTLPAAQFSEEGPGWMSSKLIAAIDATRETLDLALLEVMHKELIEAVLRARDRGVKVRVVMDSMHVYPEKPGQHRSVEIQRLIDEGIDMVMVRGRDKYGLMHNKFAIMDGRLLWSGSANWSRAADNVHKENTTYSADSHRIAGFQDVWDWMYGLSAPFGSPPGRADGEAPPQDRTRPVDFHGVGMPSYAFGPSDEAEGWLLKAISLARTSIDVAMFSCTSSRIKAALIEARGRGVTIRFVFDKSQFRYLPPMMWFVDNGFDVKLGEGYRPGKSAMHHKFVILDGELLQNGSYNWTDGARYNNFENIQFFTEAAMVGLYSAAYERLRKDSADISDDDLEANRAAASQRAAEDAAHEQRSQGPKPAVRKDGITRSLGSPWAGRRFALSPFRRS
ncbi:MAG: hypothetical protein HZB91_13290 [Elusimicrobia bacterium]|nr:hypothetical protein [Elusimicrobiota bacterium]